MGVSAISLWTNRRSDLRGAEQGLTFDRIKHGSGAPRRKSFEEISEL